MTGKELWIEYCEKCHADKNAPCEAWSFGDDPDDLAELVCAGIKTATSSLYDLYEQEPDETVPKAGDTSIILNGSGEAVCVIRNTKVYQIRFCDVSPEHACKEGEGDRSLAYWRKVHADFFGNEARRYGLNSMKIPMCCVKSLKWFTDLNN